MLNPVEFAPAIALIPTPDTKLGAGKARASPIVPVSAIFRYDPGPPLTEPVVLICRTPPP